MCCQQRHCVTYININIHTPKTTAAWQSCKPISWVKGWWNWEEDSYTLYSLALNEFSFGPWIFWLLNILWAELKHLQQTCSIGNIGITLVRSTVIFILSIHCLQQCSSAVEMTGNLLKHSFTNLIACPLLNADTKN